MNNKSIEVEIRAEVSSEDYNSLKRQLERIGSLQSHTKRLSVMYFGEVDSKKIDIRVRVTNGECEAVIKSGSFEAHNRIEVSQKISSDQFIGIVKLFSQFGFTTEVGERETFNYLMPDNIVISLVSAGEISYIELEKMSTKDDEDKNRQQLVELAMQLKLNILNSEEDFNDLCRRLSDSVDWRFYGTNNEYDKLSKALELHLNQK